MQKQDIPLSWAAFQDVNRRRRAIRDFDGQLIPDEQVRALLSEATQAPSSGNLQPYRLHWIRDAGVRARIATACNGQRAASSAPTLVVIEASREIALDTAALQLNFIEGSNDMTERGKNYHRGQMRMFGRVLRLGSWPIWTPLVSIVGLFKPSLSLLPIGHLGSRAWAARNAAFAAQTLMLAASASGIDSCPMEGFSAPKIAQVLGLPRGTVIPVVIALGYRAPEARVDVKWRRPIADVIVEH
ncbi:nitroreductase family protein [Variovorax sp. Root411]|uniref:nitroreductase family protein n=1 Tax=Variovorax sp. Root411 TaxID=1736530 RepID=UPI0006F8C87F|nr:nitroreductase family protein [Variovorax sp. Root411]KQW64891.1 NADH-ubiquinone oxidoreductase subunit 3 [Variovorax sp. Root411]